MRVGGEDCQLSLFLQCLGNRFKRLNLSVLSDVCLFLSPEGFRHPPIVNFPRRALTLPFNTSYADLTALLTVASSPSQIQHFPHLQAVDGNSSGTSQSDRRVNELRRRRRRDVGQRGNRGSTFLLGTQRIKGVI